MKYLKTYENFDDDKDKRIKELEEASMELFNLVHDSDLIQNKIRANELYDVIKPSKSKLVNLEVDENGILP